MIKTDSKSRDWFDVSGSSIIYRKVFNKLRIKSMKTINIKPMIFTMVSIITISMGHALGTNHFFAKTVTANTIDTVKTKKGSGSTAYARLTQAKERSAARKSKDSIARAARINTQPKALNGQSIGGPAQAPGQTQGKKTLAKRISVSQTPAVATGTKPSTTPRTHQ